MSKGRSEGAVCPECGHPVYIDEFDDVGDIIVCDNCNSELEITSRKPPKVKVVKEAYVEEEYDYAEEDVDYPEEDGSEEGSAFEH